MGMMDFIGWNTFVIPMVFFFVFFCTGSSLVIDYRKWKNYG